MSLKETIASLPLPLKIGVGIGIGVLVLFIIFFLSLLLLTAPNSNFNLDLSRGSLTYSGKASYSFNYSEDFSSSEKDIESLKDSEGSISISTKTRRNYHKVDPEKEGWNSLYFNPLFAYVANSWNSFFSSSESLRVMLLNVFKLKRSELSISYISMKSYFYSKKEWPYPEYYIMGLYNLNIPFKIYYKSDAPCFFKTRGCEELISFSTPSQDFYNTLKSNVCDYISYYKKTLYSKCYATDYPRNTFCLNLKKSENNYFISSEGCEEAISRLS